MLERIEAGRITETRLMEMVFPEQANHYGTLFGGQALALMDKAAFMVASRFARLPVVTLTGERALGTRGRFALVALDGSGKPTGVPSLDSTRPPTGMV